MRKFENPSLEVMNLSVEDVITTSTCVGDGESSCSNETIIER